MTSGSRASPTGFEAGPRHALATGLYCEGCVSLGKAAQVAGLSVNEFIDHVGSLGIDIVRDDEATSGEAADLAAWLSMRRA